MNDIKVAQDKLYDETNVLNSKFNQINDLMSDLSDLKNLKVRSFEFLFFNFFKNLYFFLIV